MFRWLRERRQRKQKEAAERRAQLRRKAQLSHVSVPESMRQPHRYPEPEVIPFYMTLAPDGPDQSVAMALAVEQAGREHRQQQVEVTSMGSRHREFVDVGPTTVTQHHHGSGDNVGGSVHHDSHSSHDYGSSSSSYDSSSYDSSSYDSGGSSSGSDSSW